MRSWGRVEDKNTSVCANFRDLWKPGVGVGNTKTGKAHEDRI